MKKLFFLLFVLSGSVSFAQTKNYDSLMVVIADKAKPFDERYKLAVSTNYNGNFDLEIKAHRLLVAEAKKMEDKTIAVRLYNTITFACIDKLDMEAAKLYCDTTLYYADKIEDTDVKAFSYYIAGNLYNVLEDFTNSHHYFYKSLEYYKLKETSPHMVPHIYHCLAASYFYQGDLPNLKKVAENIITVSSELNYPDGLVDGDYLKAAYFAETYYKDTTLTAFLDSAIIYNKNAIAVFEKMEQPIIKATIDNIAICYGNLASYMLLYKKGDYLNLATKYVEKARQFTDLNNIPGLGSIHSISAKIAHLQHNSQKAKEEAFKALKIFTENEATPDNNELFQLYIILSDIYTAEGNYKEALKYEKLKNEVNEKMKEEKRYATIKELETKYEVNRKEDEIQQLKEINDYQQRVRNLYIVLLVLVAISLGILIWRYITKRRADAAQLRVTELQKTEAELQTKLEKERAERLNAKVEEKEKEYQTLLKETELQQIRNYLKGLEAERTRLAKELHDGISNELVALKMQIEQGESKAGDIAQSITTIHSTLRQLSHELLPPVFQYASLPEILTDYCHRLNSNGKTKISLLIEPESGWDNFSQETALEIYRIIQETLGNTLKYAQAKTSSIHLHCSENKVKLQVKDDGKGFDEKAVDKKGVGLRIIRERVESMNGQFAIITQPGKGVTVDVVIPVNKR